jgi:phosphoglycerate dehydrogenase-like enzyme
MQRDSVIVLVTDSEYRKAPDVFASATPLLCHPAPGDEDALAAAIVSERARHVIVGHRPYRGPLYAALERGGVIARFGVGHEGLDKAQAAARGLICTNTPGVLDQSVAELTMLLISAAARRFSALRPQLDADVWTPPVGVELKGKTLALIGYGRIARALARIAARGFGMSVVGFRRSAGHTETVEPDVTRMTDNFADAVRGAAFVSLHLPTTPETRSFLNEERLALLGPETWLINPARGAVVDEAALYDALAAGRLGGAALDVYAREPYVPIDPARDLRRLPNVILTPHVGSHTREANRAMASRALQNIRLAMEGRFGEMDIVT